MPCCFNGDQICRPLVSTAGVELTTPVCIRDGTYLATTMVLIMPMVNCYTSLRSRLGRRIEIDNVDNH